MPTPVNPYNASIPPTQSDLEKQIKPPPTSAYAGVRKYVILTIIIVALVGFGYYLSSSYNSTLLGVLHSNQSGSGSSYITKNEITALTGTSGNYSSTHLSSTQINSTRFPNVTDMWNVSYQYGKGSGNAINISESVVRLRAQGARSYYSLVLGLAMSFGITGSTGFNGINMTQNGMTYSYATLNTSTYTYLFLLGYKNSEVTGLAYRAAPSLKISSSKIASVVAGDMP